MLETLLRTKFFAPPKRPNLVPRLRLVEKLNQGLQLDHKLALISAPAGFGKTTLIADWGTRIVKSTTSRPPPPHGRPFHTPHFCWLSLDEGDNDLVRFLTYFVAALNKAEAIEAPIGDGALNMLQSPQPPPTEDILISLINEVSALPNRIIFILDDYHLIETQSIHNALAFLIEHLPPQMHLVIATREDPHLSLARLRAQGLLTELRAADLRFSPSETAELLNQVMGLNLSAENIVVLETRTEGWITGLQLAAISMQGREDTNRIIKSFTGSHRFVLDYLIEEVLKQQPAEIQTFLLQTAVLDRLTASLCDSVTGKENGRETLEMLDRANLFIIPLDDERQWYRYHHLFADLLRRRLHQNQSEQLQILNHRASVWFEQNGFIDKAIEHALTADDFEQAANLIEDYANGIWKRGEHTKLRRWLKALPEKIVYTKPQLCIFNAWDLFVSGQDEAAERSLQVAEQAQGISHARDSKNAPLNQDQLPSSNQMEIRGRAAVIRSFLASHRRDVTGIIQHARQALEYLPTQDSAWRNAAATALGDAHAYKGDITAVYQARIEELETSKLSGNIYITMIANLKLTLILRMQGVLQRAIKICQQQMQMANESGLSQTAIAGGLLATWGELLAETNNLGEALHKAKKGAELIEPGRDVAMLCWSHVCLMRVLLSRGELAEAEKVIQKMNRLTREIHVPPTMADLIAAWQARLWVTQRKLDAASQWMAERGLDFDGTPTYQNEIEYIAVARLLITQGHLDEAARLLRVSLEVAKSGDRIARMIEISILQALACQAGDKTDQAVLVLEEAIRLAKPGGFIRIFVDEGQPMARLLQEALTRGITPDYTRRLLAAFPAAKPALTALPQTQSTILEPLSEREIEVLQRIAEGLTNREIADRLYLSLNTVKVHTRNIYGKLDVHNRTEAVNKARALAILPA